jgi:putative membrane protein
VTPPDTAGFVREAAAANRFEIAAGQLAQTRAGSADVRRFAGDLVKDHDYALGQLQKAIAVSGETLSGEGGPTAEQSATLAELGRAAPASFDRSFLDAQLKAHQDALTLLQAYAENGQNAAVKAWAGQSLAGIQQHLSEAQRLRERTG